PAEMVKLVTFVGHRHGVNDLTVILGAGIDVDDSKGVRLGKIRAEQHGVGEALRRSFHGELWRSVKRGVGPNVHRTASLFASMDSNTARRHATARNHPAR